MELHRWCQTQGGFIATDWNLHILAKWHHVATMVWVSVGSGSGLTPDGTKPLPEPMLSWQNNILCRVGQNSGCRWHGYLSFVSPGFQWYWVTGKGCYYLPWEQNSLTCYRVPIECWLTETETKWLLVWRLIFSDSFSWMKKFIFRLKFRWNLIAWVQLTISHHWFS